jgi:hypothetical protein
MSLRRGKRLKEDGNGQIVFAVLFPRIAHFWQNFPKRLAE